MGNNITGTPGHGINIANNVNLTAQILENSVTETVKGSGIEIRLTNHADFIGDISYNNLSRNHGDGLHIDSLTGFNTGSFTGNIIGNNMSENTKDGDAEWAAFLSLGGTFTGDIAYNTILDNEAYGFTLTTPNMVGDIHHNVAARNGEPPFHAATGAYGFIVYMDSFTGDIHDNLFSENESEGLFFQINGDFTGSFYGNVSINDNLDNSMYGSGMVIFVGGTYTGDFRNNTVLSENHTTGWGLYFAAGVFDAQNGKYGVFGNVATGSRLVDFLTGADLIINGPLSSTANPGSGIIQDYGPVPIATH